MARVLLLFGGRSAEHEVSCVSAVAVTGALREAGHHVVPVGIDRTGQWHLADPSRSPMQAEGRRVVLEVPGGVLRAGDDELTVDVVFPVLHGPFGEDGTIQGALEMAGVPYVGCGVLPSAVAMDKDIAKRLLARSGLQTPAWDVVRGDDFVGSEGLVVEHLTRKLGLPVFVKPAELGSSVGVAKATTDARLKDAIEDALRLGDKVIVEESVKGREIEVAVLDGPRVSVPGEIVIEADWYDYTAKYNDSTSQFVTPADLSPARTAEVRDLAARAFTTLECRGLARVDFFYEQGRRGFLVNEVNTMPGFTPISGFPAMWQASGMTYAELCHELVTLALQ
jgi:D-alanine-D-alanine ligase